MYTRKQSKLHQRYLMDKYQLNRWTKLEIPVDPILAWSSRGNGKLNPLTHWLLYGSL